ncbi:EAL domain-containing protein [Halomonas alimentaria]|uniref:EAL domain-containing protein n=1 Tax=Halomonas alimentaria TaxID=147248 RepID=A0A7X4W716_9GAMM|nr:EAL domain-containing protein [Halomonas alimentaria]
MCAPAHYPLPRRPSAAGPADGHRPAGDRRTLPDAGRRRRRHHPDAGQPLILEVTAEGVETEEQLHWLKARGYRLFQGFLLVRPEPLMM